MAKQATQVPAMAGAIANQATQAAMAGAIANQATQVPMSVKQPPVPTPDRRLLMRTLYCGELSAAAIDQTVVLCGWVHRRRDHGGVIFLDLRDRSGIAQIVFDPDAAESFALADQVRNEYVLQVEGRVRARPAGSENPDMPTGEVEVLGATLELLNRSDTPPFQLDEYSDAGDEVRLQYRYIDLRRPEMFRALQSRAQIVACIRRLLEARGFLDVETPLLGKSTPEGARDYLVPSRIHSGQFFALPQSPQIYKQLLMMSGIDRYYQIAKCFRDEDLRADRQPEFTQIDIEASFVDAETIMTLTEEMLRELFQQQLAIDLPAFARLTWSEALATYGSDKPNLLNPLYFVDVDDLVKDTAFEVFRGPATAPGGRVTAMRVPGAAARLSRKQLDDYAGFVGQFGAKGLAYIKVNDPADASGLQSPILKFLGEATAMRIIERLAAEAHDIVFFGAGDAATVNASLGAFRDRIAADLDLIQSGFKFCWVTHFPMFESPARGQWTPLHHPFTRPDATPEQVRTDPGKVLSHAYDIVLNGFEIGGGSLRIHDIEMQRAVFEVLGLADRAQKSFAALLNGLKHGCPPHGGIALGLDRLVMLMTGAHAIREVIAFPKTQTASDLMMGAPDDVTTDQLQELALRPLGGDEDA